ncbi:acetyl-CoA carboxylase biotin carboxyl carrier protein [Clostridia bacterium]|nr:acetyl-CoA carboxylase biotin carboxyl carrier protein [Clostridia bacterium]
MNIKEIKQLMAALEESTMDRLEIQENDFKLVLSKNQAVAYSKPPTVLETPIQKIVPAEEEDSNLVYVTSPIVGTYYAAPAPGEPDFVQVGDHVKAGEVVCIIEAMKLMNEIKAEMDGVVKAILVENEDGIEHGQKIIAIDPRS